MRREEAAKLAPGTWCRCAYSVGHRARVEAVEDGGRRVRMLTEWQGEQVVEPRLIRAVLPPGHVPPEVGAEAERRRDAIRARQEAAAERRKAWDVVHERARRLRCLVYPDQPSTSATVWARTAAEANAVLDVVERLRAGGES